MGWTDAIRRRLEGVVETLQARQNAGGGASIGGGIGANPGVGARVSGRPPSGNGASSMHLRWDFGPGGPDRFREASVTITVDEPPAVAELYFWALQASFLSGRRPVGAGHMGLQHHPRHPGNGAANWGGYHQGGGELPGSPLTIPSALGNANSGDYVWRPHAPYRYRIFPSPDRGWRASITDVEQSTTVELRDLHPEADALSGIIMWSEIFAPCDGPSVTVRWSDPVAITLDGGAVRPVGYVANYQTHADGGCDNSTARATSTGVIQQTNCPRAVGTGDRLPVEASPSDRA